MRRLFLDDDPARAAQFLQRHPQATWVETVPACVAQLAERWDEVHLDHDLGGEQFVASDRADCGMEVVRWLTLAPRPHLKRTRFTVHSHNMLAAYEMVFRLDLGGFRVRAQPFGVAAPAGPPAWLDIWRRFQFGTLPRLRQWAERLGHRLRVWRQPVVRPGGPPGRDEANGS